MKIVLPVLCVLLACATSFSQVKHSSELYRTLEVQDSLLFTIGFNGLDTAIFNELLNADFEFYHDKAGMLNSKAAFIQSIKALGTLTYKPQRQLIEGSLEVFPLEKNGVLYGAIQRGEHQFYALNIPKPSQLTATARFIHVWLLENNRWKLSRALSYDHTEPAKNEPSDSLLFSDRKATDQWAIEHRIPALGIAFIEGGTIRQAAVYGQDDVGNSHPLNTIFDVASLTKPITALVTLKLVAVGKWDLDEPIFHYWIDPDLENDSRHKLLTTRLILSHRSGFPNWRDGRLIFEYTPGTRYQYSGEGFEYLRKALERKFHKTLDQLAAELIFQPLGMNNTRFFRDSTFDESHFAGRFTGNGTKYETQFSTSANAANHLLTTIEDYSKFVLYMLNGAGLPQEIYEQMVSEQTRVKPRKYWGLGWWVDEQVNGTENALVHGGDDNGVHTIVFLLPLSKKALLIFTNCDNGTEVYIPIIKHYLAGTGGEGIIEVETGK